MNKHLFSIVGLIALCGCANESPLVFVSKTSFGLDVSTPGAGTGEFSATIGVKTLDAAYVPVVEITDAGMKTVTQVKSGESITPERQAEIVRTLTQRLQEESHSLEQQNSQLMSFTNIESTGSTNNVQAAALNSIKSTQQNINDLNQALISVLNRNDALSVFSAFDSNSLIHSTEVGTGIGKVFATGIAAQHVSSNFTPQMLVNCKDAVAPAAAKLAAEADQASKDMATKLLAACK